MSSPLTHGGRGADKAFTLIELLTVIAIIGILSAITFGVVDGVKNRAAIGRAKSELAVIAQALEAYKRQYGDYPRVLSTDTNLDAFAVPSNPLTTDRAYHFFRALVGRTGPTRSTLQRENPPGTFTNKYGKAFIDSSKFSLERREASDKPAGNNPLPEANTSGSDPDFVNALLDPWGNRYVYFYKTVTNPGGAWLSSTYILMSAGPDKHIKWMSGNPVPADGNLPDTFYTDVESTGPAAGKGNPDNIYAAR